MFYNWSEPTEDLIEFGSRWDGLLLSSGFHRKWATTTAIYNVCILHHSSDNALETIWHQIAFNI